MPEIKNGIFLYKLLFLIKKIIVIGIVEYPINGIQ